MSGCSRGHNESLDFPVDWNRQDWWGPKGRTRIFTTENIGLAAQHGYISAATELSGGIHLIVFNGSLSISVFSVSSLDDNSGDFLFDLTRAAHEQQERQRHEDGYH
jgi:hypothetical protein